MLTLTFYNNQEKYLINTTVLTMVVHVNLKRCQNSTEHKRIVILCMLDYTAIKYYIVIHTTSRSQLFSTVLKIYWSCINYNVRDMCSEIFHLPAVCLFLNSLLRFLSSFSFLLSSAPHTKEISIRYETCAALLADIQQRHR